MREAVGHGRDRGIECRSRSGSIAARLGDQRLLDLDLGAQPRRRQHPPFTDREDPRLGLGQLPGGIVEPTLRTRRSARQCGRLGIEDRGAFGRGQRGVDPADLLGRCAFAVDLRRHRNADQPPPHALVGTIVVDRRDRPGEFGQRCRRLVLVDLIEASIIADHPLDHAIATRRLGFGLVEQHRRRREIAEVGLLKPLVGQCFGQPGRMAMIARREILEKFGRFGEAPAIIAAIGFAARTRRVERSGLRPGEGGGVADLGYGNAHFAFLRAVADDRRERQPQRRVIARQPFGQIAGLAASDRIAAVIELRGLVAAGHRPHRADPVDDDRAFPSARQRPSR